MANGKHEIRRQKHIAQYKLNRSALHLCVEHRAIERRTLSLTYTHTPDCFKTKNIWVEYLAKTFVLLSLYVARINDGFISASVFPVYLFQTS